MATISKSSCNSCQQEVKTKDRIFKCTKCENSFHCGCIGVSKHAASVISSAQGQFSLICRECTEAKGSSLHLEENRANESSISTLSEQIKSLTPRMEALKTRENSDDVASNHSSHRDTVSSQMSGGTRGMAENDVNRTSHQGLCEKSP